MDGWGARLGADEADAGKERLGAVPRGAGRLFLRRADSEEEDDDGAEARDFEETEEDEDCPQGWALIEKLMQEDTPYGTAFQMATAFVIVLCTLTLAVEADFYPDWAMWWWWNSLTLLFFCLELGVRMAYHKANFFACCGGSKELCWNYLDSFIVLASIVDQWILPFLPSNGPEDTAAEAEERGLRIVRIFRVFRILRTLRVIRIFRACKQLTSLSAGLLDSLGTVFWIALLMLMYMLIFAIILTDIAGNEAKEARQSGDLFYETREDIITNFGSVRRSLWTFFQILTLDDWSAIARQVDDEIPQMWLVFFCYIFLMGFAMLSLLTAVVAQHMAQVSAESQERDWKRRSKELTEFLEALPRFRRACTADSRDSSGGTVAEGGPNSRLTKEAFNELMTNPAVRRQLVDMDANIADLEVDEFWECLDRDDDGTITHRELVNGLHRLRGKLEPKDMLRMRYAAERVARRLQGGPSEAATTGKLQEVVKDLDVAEATLHSLKETLANFMEGMGNRTAAATPSKRQRGAKSSCVC